MNTTNFKSDVAFKFAAAVVASLITGLITINILLVQGLRSDFKEMDTKLFHHLTNADLHTPRSILDSQVNELRTNMMQNRILIETNLNEIKKEILDEVSHSKR